MKKYILCCACLFAFTAAFAQEREHIETDRPNETEVPYIVPRKYFQFETGVRTEKKSENNRLFSTPELLAKYGITDQLEFRIKTSYSTRIEHYIPNDKVTSGIEPVEIGLKLAVLKEKRWIPKTALLFQTGIPRVSTGAFRAKHLAPTLRLLMENNITDRFSLNYNAGAEWDGFETDPEWMYSVVPGIDIGDHFHVFTELYCFLQNNEPSEYTLDGGMEYFIGKNIALDVCSGFGLNKAASPFFLTLGGSVKFR